MVKIYSPKYEDLWFREKLLSDPDTMTYNNAWGGTIDFPESKWQICIIIGLKSQMEKGFIDI